MRFKQFINEEKEYWKFPSIEDMKSDFAEYKVKEDYKWKARAINNGFRFPIFKDFDDYKKTLKSGKVKLLTPQLNAKFPSTELDSIDDLRSLVHSYHRPRDIDRIVYGFKHGQKIPYPVILKGSRGYFRLSGNTRTNTAKILGIPVKVLIVDVSDKK